jgi:hypothetical protein
VSPLSQLATELRATTSHVKDLEDGIVRPAVGRLRELAGHFGVSQDDIDLEPVEPPSPGERIVDPVERA